MAGVLEVSRLLFSFFFQSPFLADTLHLFRSSMDSPSPSSSCLGTRPSKTSTCTALSPSNDRIRLQASSSETSLRFTPLGPPPAHRPWPRLPPRPPLPRSHRRTHLRLAHPTWGRQKSPMAPDACIGSRPRSDRTSPARPARSPTSKQPPAPPPRPSPPPSGPRAVGPARAQSHPSSTFAAKVIPRPTPSRPTIPSRIWPSPTPCLPPPPLLSLPPHLPSRKTMRTSSPPRPSPHPGRRR